MAGRVSDRHTRCHALLSPSTLDPAPAVEVVASQEAMTGRTCMDPALSPALPHLPRHKLTRCWRRRRCRRRRTPLQTSPQCRLQRGSHVRGSFAHVRAVSLGRRRSFAAAQHPWHGNCSAAIQRAWPWAEPDGSQFSRACVQQTQLVFNKLAAGGFLACRRLGNVFELIRVHAHKAGHLRQGGRRPACDTRCGTANCAQTRLCCFVSCARACRNHIGPGCQTHTTDKTRRYNAQRAS